MLLILYKDFIEAKGSQRPKNNGNEVEATVEDVGDLHLSLADGFVLLLRDVLFVPSLRRNLISISRIDDEDIHYHFGDKHCTIQFGNNNVDLAIRRDVLYLLSHCDVVNE